MLVHVEKYNFSCRNGYNVSTNHPVSVLYVVPRRRFPLPQGVLARTSGDILLQNAYRETGVRWKATCHRDEQCFSRQ